MGQLRKKFEALFEHPFLNMQFTLSSESDDYYMNQNAMSENFMPCHCVYQDLLTCTLIKTFPFRLKLWMQLTRAWQS